MDEANRPGEGRPRTEGVADGSPPAPKEADGVDAAEAPRPVVPGNVGSLDDVPADAAGVAVAEEGG